MWQIESDIQPDPEYKVTYACSPCEECKRWEKLYDQMRAERDMYRERLATVRKPDSIICQQLGKILDITEESDEL